MLRRVRRRIAAGEALRAVAGGLGAYGAGWAATWRAGYGVRVAIAAGAAVGCATLMSIVRRHRRSSGTPAEALERAYPGLRNLAVTAAELLEDPDRTRPYMWNRVMQDAARSLAGVDVSRAVPLGRELAGVAIAASLLAIVMTFGPVRRVPTDSAPVSGPAQGALASGDVAIDVTPPAYTGRAAMYLRNPASIEALAGSVATIRVAGVERPSVRVNGSPVGSAGGQARSTLIESGYVAIDAGGVHRLLPLTVTPDAAPDVRVTTPGKDVRVADAYATIGIRATAADDLGLRALDLRYTVVSGGGERFSFREGTMPATVAKASSRNWTADARLSLAALKLEPGDALIYRAVASDGRPGAAGEASSDTYFVEVAGPGDVALEGVDMPPDRERYALSQAMVVVKIQRLIAREAHMPRAEVGEAAATIAAEQRAVRANFIFLLGGGVEDEIVEAEASHEIQERRLANQARREIVAATIAMQKVERALAAVTARAALPPAQDAVKALQRAFGHSRYLLRALPARIRIDPARRMSGDLGDARDWRRDPGSPTDDRQAEAARRAVAEAAAIANNPRAADARDRLERLAESVLAIAPGAADVQSAARRILEARDAFAAGDVGKGRAELQAALAPLLTRAQSGRADAPPVPRDTARLAGALAGGSR